MAGKRTNRHKRQRPGPKPSDRTARYLLKLSPELLQSARDSAEQQGLSLAEWWRNAGLRELGAAVTRPDPRLVE